jgi:hypothetical protein
VPYSLPERELGSSTRTTIDCRARKAINERDRAYFTTVKQLQEHIDAFIRALQSDRTAVRVDEEKGLSAALQGPPYHSTLIQGTRPLSP